jgi:integrase/recombinase XerD
MRPPCASWAGHSHSARHRHAQRDSNRPGDRCSTFSRTVVHQHIGAPQEREALDRVASHRLTPRGSGYRTSKERTHMPLRVAGGECLALVAAHGEWMTTSSFVPTSAGEQRPLDDAGLSLAVAAYVARFKGLSRQHTDSDLRAFLGWCAERGIEPLSAQRRHLELYVRWMQEARRYEPSTVSRRTSVLCGFYRICVIDGLLEHSPAEYVRRPTVPAESPTLGLTHLQFEALLGSARESANRNDFALIAMLGLLGLRICEATGADIADLGEEHGHRVLRVVGKGTRVVLVPLPPAVGRAVDRAVDGRVSGPILRNTRGRRMDRHAATRRLRRLAAHAGVRLPRMHPHAPTHLRHHHARRGSRPA